MTMYNKTVQLTYALTRLFLFISACAARVSKASSPTSAVRRINPNHLHAASRVPSEATFLRISPSTGTTVTLASTPNTLLLLSLVRGGASANKSKKKKGGGRSASLFSATGQKKVGAAKQEKKSALSDTLVNYKAILPLTRVYITLVGICTLFGMVVGDEITMALLSLDPMRITHGLQLWRPITAATFLGPPSISWLMSAYYLFEYGSSLEKAYGTAQHVVFLFSQIVSLSLLSALFGLPFFANSVITAMLHVLSRSMPNEKVKWLIFTVPYWVLPYGLMASDVLQQQGSLSAAMPHVLGILSGHVYFFNKFIWPKKCGVVDSNWLVAPQFLIDYFDPDARRAAAAATKKGNEKRKQKGKGRKLGR